MKNLLISIDTKIVIFGGGQIGTACGKFLGLLPARYEIWDKQCLNPGAAHIVDIDMMRVEDIIAKLAEAKATHVIVAMPFSYNEKIAQAAAAIGCHYIDFTEDDVMADKVQAIYKDTELTCAVKCGLAPGFINYIGHSLVKLIDKTEHLMISVGALPRNVNWSKPSDNYNLSWSVDGLVNEFIRPCRIKKNGKAMEIAPLTGLEQVIADGVAYEAAFTSGGVGSLVKELIDVPNIAYKTLRYPGHYKYVIDAVKRHQGNFDALKKEFLTVFPFNKDDVIVVYAEAKGRDVSGQYKRETFATHFIGNAGLSAIQSTTAGGGIAVLEMMLDGQIKGIINHADISIIDFIKTRTYPIAYTKR